MSRKQKLAEEWLKENEWDYQKYADKRGDQSAYDTRMLYEISDLLEWAFLAGYAACEQDAKVIEEKFEKLVKECLIEAGFREQEPHPTVKECVDVLAKWKERGE